MSLTSVRLMQEHGQTMEQMWDQEEERRGQIRAAITAVEDMPSRVDELLAKCRALFATASIVDREDASSSLKFSITMGEVLVTDVVAALKARMLERGIEVTHFYADYYHCVDMLDFTVPSDRVRLPFELP